MNCVSVVCVVRTSVSVFFVFFFKQKTAYEMRISDWSSVVCSSDLASAGRRCRPPAPRGTAIPDSGLRLVVEVDRHHQPVRLGDQGAELGGPLLVVLPVGVEIGSASCRERVCSSV